MTAVEWLIGQIKDDWFLAAFYDEFNQAKEMEKQQVINSWDNGYETGYGYLSSKFDNAEQYYNETFKNK